LNAAIHLAENGIRDVAVITDLLGGGTSANTGSDKQTYYKLALSKIPDSPYEMAKDLFNGGGMDGDIALVEAELSLKEFYHLIALGVKFPHNEYGEYIGYKTDHDKKCRATSAGPLTSQEMYACLLKRSKELKIRIIDRLEVIELICAGTGAGKKVTGFLALDKRRLKDTVKALRCFECENIVLATGGPAGIYKDSVYPGSQTGSIGLALMIGAKAKNLTESQYGLASIKFRWNLSGTYQQAIPRYFSTDASGKDEKEFLNEFFPSIGKLASAIFLKGYQWPFDPRKIENHGSSLIDLLVYRETKVKGRRVFMDFRRNPSFRAASGEFKLKELSAEAFIYLKKSGALLKTPYERLKNMNPAAIELYRGNSIDLAKEPLEIAVCAQHNNGGLSGNIWWETDIKRLFAIGEVNGTHGVYRPGGSALNSGQVGGFRCAQYISKRYNKKSAVKPGKVLRAKTDRLLARVNKTDGVSREALTTFRNSIRERMSKYGAQIRPAGDIETVLKEAREEYNRLSLLEAGKHEDLLYLLKTIELSFTQLAYLEAIKYYIKKGGTSRGSYIVMKRGGILPHKALGKDWKFCKPGKRHSDRVLETVFKRGKFSSSWRKVRSVPEKDFWFETVWNAFREDKIIV